MHIIPKLKPMFPTCDLDSEVSPAKDNSFTFHSFRCLLSKLSYLD